MISNERNKKKKRFMWNLKINILMFSANLLWHEDGMFVSITWYTWKDQQKKQTNKQTCDAAIIAKVFLYHFLCFWH
jgi:hypothetical protein